MSCRCSYSTLTTFSGGRLCTGFLRYTSYLVELGALVGRTAARRTSDSLRNTCLPIWWKKLNQPHVKFKCMQYQGCNTCISMTHCILYNHSSFFVSTVFSFIFTWFVFKYCGFIVCIKYIPVYCMIWILFNSITG